MLFLFFMGDNDTLLIVGLVGLGIYALKDSISGVTKPISQVEQSTADLYSSVVGGIQNTGESYLKSFRTLAGSLQASVSGYNQGVYNDTEKPVKLSLLSNSPFNVNSGSNSSVVQKNTNPTIKTSSSNTIFTNPKNLASKSLNVTSAQSMIELSRNPKIQNIATNVGNTTVITKKSVNLGPSLLSSVIG